MPTIAPTRRPHQTDAELATNSVKALAKNVVLLFTLMANRVKKIEDKTHLRTNLAAGLLGAVKRIENTDDLDDILNLSADERIETYTNHFDKFLEDAKAEHEELSHTDIFGGDNFDDQLVDIGEKIESLRKKVITEHGRNHDYDFTPNFGRPKATAALAAVQGSLEKSGFETLVVGFQKKSIGERMRARKQRIKWLRTSEGRSYLRKQKLRKKMHKRKDPKRSKLLRKVAQVY